MASTVRDAALSLRETVSCADIIATMTAVTLRKNGRELAGACPKCGGDDRFYVTQDNACACRKCHTQRMDAVGLVAWLQNVTMHEAVDILSGGRQYSQLPAPPATQKTRRTDKDDAYNATWRSKVAGEAQRNYFRLLEETAGAASARSYLRETRGLAPDTWQAFCIGYQEKTHVTGTQRTAPAISWPMCTQDGSVYGMKYRFLEAQDVGADEPLRYTMRYGSRISVDTGALFGAQLLYADATRRYRCLVICEGELNGASIWQAANVAGVDVVSIGSESNKLPDWAIDYASGYSCVITWLDTATKAQETKAQLANLPHVLPLQSPVREEKQDANACLLRGTLSALIQSARLRALPVAQHESVLWQLWDVRHLLDAMTVKLGEKLAEKLGVSW